METQWMFDVDRLKLAREMKDLTQSQLAEKIGVQPQQVSSWEQGRVLPGQDSLVKICNALQCPPKFFFTQGVDISKH